MQGQGALADPALAGADGHEMAHPGEPVGDPGALLGNLLEDSGASVAGDVVVALHLFDVAYTVAQRPRRAMSTAFRRALRRAPYPDRAQPGPGVLHHADQHGAQFVGRRDGPGEGHADGARTLRCLRRHVEAIAVHAGHRRGRDIGCLRERLAVEHHRVGVVGVHMSNRAGRVRRERIRFGGLPVVLGDPGHPSVAPDIPDGIHAQLPEREVAEVGVVGGIRMHGQERGASAAIISFDTRARSQHGDAAVGERIVSAILRHHQGGARIALEVLGMFGHPADQKNRVALVKSDGHERAVGVPLRLERQRAQGPRRDPSHQGARSLGVRGRRNIHVVQRLRRPSRRLGMSLFAHGRRALLPQLVFPCDYPIVRAS